MEKIWKEFKRYITEVREIIEKYNDEEIFEEHSEKSGSPYPDRFPFYNIGEYSGSGVYLYDNDGEGIVNRGH